MLKNRMVKYNIELLREIMLYLKELDTDKSKKASQKGISINSLEAKAGISTGSVYKWNRVSPTVRNLSKVAEVLGCTIDELLQEE